MINFPLYQLIICVIWSLVILLWIFFVRPFEKWISNLVNFFNEVVILTAFSISFFFQTPMPDAESFKYSKGYLKYNTDTLHVGIIILAGIGLASCINLIVMLYFTAILVGQKFKEFIKAVKELWAKWKNRNEKKDEEKVDDTEKEQNHMDEIEEEG